MSFLDRFKPQPRWKHADAAVRAASIAEIPDDAEHGDVIAELAATDEDVRVRRAALLRVSDVAVLVSRARAEADPELRRDLADRLVAVAIAPAETDAAAALALSGLDDPRQFATIAKSSPHDTIRAAALGQVHEQKALSSIARHALDPQTAADAVARLTDGPELLNVALKTDHRDAGISALEKALSDASLDEASMRDTLTTVHAKARSKPVAKRARALLSAMQDAEAARRMALEQWQHRVASVVARAEAIAANPSAPSAGRELAEAEAEWRDVAASGTFELDPDTAGRFGAVVESARTGIAAAERAEAERRAAAEHTAALRAVRMSLCERLERVAAENALEELESARAEWEGLPEPSAEIADRQLHDRFLEASRAAVERHANFLDRIRINERLEALSFEAERLSSDEQDAEEAWAAVQNEWASLQLRTDALDPVIAERFGAADARVRLRAEEQRAAAERTLRQQVQRIEQLIERANARALADDLTLREADRIAREVRAAIDAAAAARPGTPGPCRPSQGRAGGDRTTPPRAARDGRMEAVRERRRPGRADRADRGAAGEVRVRYARRREARRHGEGRARAARNPGALEAGRRGAARPGAGAVAPLPPGRRPDPGQGPRVLRPARRGAEGQPRAQARAHRARRGARRLDRLDQDRRRTEEAAGASGRRSARCRASDTRATWKRFREACDTFFTRRNADLAQRKETWAANQAKKEALCARAEELAASTRLGPGGRGDPAAAGRVEDGRPGAPDQVRGAVAALPRCACDTFFDRYKRRDEIELEARAGGSRGAGRRSSSRWWRCRSDDAELHAPEVMGDIAPPAPRRTTTPRCSSGCARCGTGGTSRRRSCGRAPIRSAPGSCDALERLIAAYPEAFRGTELDVDANRQKMEKLCERVEGFLPRRLPRRASSSQALADDAARGARVEHDRRPRRRRNEVAGDGRRRPAGAGVVDAASGRCRARPAGS